MVNEGGSSDDLFGGLFNSLADQVEGLKGDDRSAYDSLEYYSRYVMADQEGLPPNSKFLSRIYNSLQYDNENVWLILGPRQSAKSTAISVTYTTWKIGRNPLIRFLMCFASLDVQGKPFGRQIDQILTRNQRYMRIFGDLKPPVPEKWTETEKIVIRNEPPGGMKDATISIIGLGSNAPSKRADELICDDLVTAENAYSAKERETVKSFVLQTLFPILIPGGRRIIVGSRWDPRDLYTELANMWNLELPAPGDIDIGELREFALP